MLIRATGHRRAPVRILHVVGGMVRGGIETWLMHVLRSIDRERFRIDILVHTLEPGAYDAEARALGCRIFACPDHARPWIYARNFRRIIEQNGPYDIVHSHVDHFSGYVLMLAQQAGVPLRIAHSHNDTSPVQADAGLARRGYLALMKRLIARHASVKLAASQKAARSLFVLGERSYPDWELLYYGVDLAPFSEPLDRPGIRTELGLPADSFVVGHVGRFVEQKNHGFLIDIASEVVRRDPGVQFLLVGEGRLRSSIERKVVEAGLAAHMVFAGGRDDVPRLMRGAMDLFLLPSLFEGLPLVGIEAQAAGLPFVASDAITEEMDAVAPLIRRLPVTDTLARWADIILAVRAAGPSLPRETALALVEQSPFNIKRSVERMEDVYGG